MLYYYQYPYIPSSAVVDIQVPRWIQELLLDQIVKWPQFLRINVEHAYLSEQKNVFLV